MDNIQDADRICVDLNESNVGQTVDDEFARAGNPLTVANALRKITDPLDLRNNPRRIAMAVAGQARS